MTTTAHGSRFAMSKKKKSRWGWLFGIAAKMPLLERLVSHVTVPWIASARLPVPASAGRHILGGRVAGHLRPTWAMRMEFLAPGFKPDPALVTGERFRSGLADRRYLCVCISLCLSSRQNQGHHQPRTKVTDVVCSNHKI